MVWEHSTGNIRSCPESVFYEGFRVRDSWQVANVGEICPNVIQANTLQKGAVVLVTGAIFATVGGVVNVPTLFIMLGVGTAVGVALISGPVVQSDVLIELEQKIEKVLEIPSVVDWLCSTII